MTLEIIVQKNPYLLKFWKNRKVKWLFKNEPFQIK